MKFFLALSAWMLMAAPGATAQELSPEAQEVAAVVEAFHSALAAGDSATALDLLTDDVVILENGRMETKDHYRSGHLAGDIRFAQAVERVRGEIDVKIDGGIAWASSTSTTQGQMGERLIDSLGAELMVLTRDRYGWRIRAIHWSSRSRQ